MKSSSYIKHIAKTNILKKGQRTWLSIFSILLSTAIIFTSLTLFLNVFTFSKNVNYDDIGNYHYACLIEDDILPSSRYTMTKDINTNLYGSYNQSVFNWRELYVEDESVLPFTITNGSLPTSSKEVLVSDTWQVNVGDTIQLSSSLIEESSQLNGLYQIADVEQSLLSTKTSSYKVVGTYHSTSSYLDHTSNTAIVYSIFDEELHTNAVYYVVDDQIQLGDAYSYFLDRFGVDENDVYRNSEVISNDTIENYLKDTTVILLMFVIIVVIGVCVSLISVHNVLIISDKDRKKELGLLKSIGATPKEIEKLITIELIFLGIAGSILGILLGGAISYVVLNLFIEKLYITFSYSMILNPIIIGLSMVGGTALMYVSGMNAYKKYIYSTAISDLKESNYDYSEPVKITKKRHRMFAWKMFTIYNGRMKKQSKNIYQSFTLYLFTCILFMSTFLSNSIYVTRYTKKGYDFDITNYGGNTTLDVASTAIAYEIYEKEDEGAFAAQTIYTERIMLPTENEVFFMTREDAYDPTLLESYKSTQSALGYNTQTTDDGTVWCDTYHFPVALDDVQLEELKPYVVSGSLDNLGVNDVISIQSESNRLGQQLCTNLKVGDIATWDGMENEKTIKAIVVLPDSAYEEGLHFDYETYPRVMAFSMEAITNGQMVGTINEHIYIKLKGTTSASAMLEIIDRALYDSETFKTYECDPVALTIETNRFATFIIEVLLYPLFFMLFVVSLMNLNNVFIGNVHLKRGDISVMKSVGMNNAQLSLLFTFEYVEGYLNAALISIAVFIPIVILEKIIGIPSVYEFGSNILGTLIIGLCFLGILMIVPLVSISLKRIQKILPIENLKNVD